MPHSTQPFQCWIIIPFGGGFSMLHVLLSGQTSQYQLSFSSPYQHQMGSQSECFLCQESSKSTSVHDCQTRHWMTSFCLTVTKSLWINLTLTQAFTFGGQLRHKGLCESPGSSTNVAEVMNRRPQNLTRVSQRMHSVTGMTYFQYKVLELRTIRINQVVFICTSSFVIVIYQSIVTATNNG